MTDAQRRYVRTETLIAGAFGGVLSIVFAWLVFGGAARVPMSGAGGVVMDSVPQSFMIALMGTLVPTLLTRRRMRAGSVVRLAGPPLGLPRSAVLRALLAAVTVAGAAVLLHLALGFVAPAEWSRGAVMLFKPAYGALLGLAVGAFATRAALRDDAAG